MPQFQWKDEDMKYVLCFFPWIGVVIGLCVYLWRMICDKLEVGTLCYALIGTAIPLILTGGFHVDGFMDTMDAFCSYQRREKKLEILKDFIAICKKHNLNYFATGGTAIGALRHKGFIPWDDDIDLAFERADYEKFCQENAFWLDDYALFMALKNAFGGISWHNWEQGIRNREEAAIAKSKADYAYAVLDVDSPVTDEVIRKLESVEGVLRVRKVK